MARTSNVAALDLDDFLEHSGSLSGGGSFLKNWHKEDDRDGKGIATIDIWLHPHAKIIPLWSHSWYSIGRARDSGEPQLRSYRFNSMESESILKRGHYRDKDGQREYPPEICPFSKMMEWVYQAILSEQISWVDEIFRFDEIKGDAFSIHAGGLVGLFNKTDDELDKAEIEELRRAKIRRDEAWKESAKPRLQYVFRVVRDEEPEAGCLIALESSSLGDATKKAIAERREDIGLEKGDPFKHPYAIRWKYNDKEMFNRKYSASVRTALELTPEIQAVFDAEPTPIDDLIKPSNILELRQSFEAHWCHAVIPPWDEIFEEAEKELEGTEAGTEPESGEFGANEKTDPSKVEMVECEVCKGEMRSDEFTCPQCGTTYDPETEEVIERGTWPKPKKASGRRAASSKGK